MIETRSGIGIYVTWITRKARSESVKRYYAPKYARLKSKMGKLFARLCGVSGGLREHRTANHFVFRCNKCAWALTKQVTGNMAGSANVNTVTWWTEKAS